MRRLIILLLLLLPLPLLGQTGNPVPVPPTLGPNGIPRAGATISICANPANATPCTNYASVFQDANLTIAINQTTTPLITDGLGNCCLIGTSPVTPYIAPGLYQFTVSGTGIAAPRGPYTVVAPCIPGITCVAANGVNTWTAAQNFNAGGNLSGTWTGAPILSGQPAFSAGINFSGGQSIGSLSFNAGQTTVSGVGITTSQDNVTLETNQSETNGGATGSPSFAVFGADSNRHCATVSENNIPSGTPACLAAGQYYTASAATVSSIGATTMVTVDAGGTATANTYRFSAYVTQSVLGASCAATSTVVVNVIFQDPNAAAPQTQAIGTYTITGNGTLGIVPLTVTPGTLLIRAKTGTNVQYSTTYTPNGGCSPNPTYQVFPILEKVN